MHSTENARVGAEPGEAHEAPGNARSARAFAGARFLTTVADWRQLPDAGAPEVAFAGRSNAGKSSVINALAGHGGLARVSRTPGRTQHINFFRLRSGALLADLPGYGYAAVAKAAHRQWGRLLTRYLSARVPLAGLVLVADIRRRLTPLDRQMLDWFLPSGRPVRILLTKADKCTTGERALALRHTREILTGEYALHESQLAVQTFSATRGWGIAEASATVLSWLAAAGLPEPQKERPRHQGE